MISFLCSGTKKDHYPESEREVVFVGRSNVGKSSLINKLYGKIAYVGKTPGKTRLLNFFNVDNKYTVCDVPGYGYANVSKEKQKKFGLMIEDYIKNRSNLQRVFLLVDYRHKPTEDDILMYNYLKYYNLNITIVATKYDKIKKNGRIKQDKLIKSALKLGDDEMFIPFSTITKKGREDVLKIIESYL